MDPSELYANLGWPGEGVGQRKARLSPESPTSKGQTLPLINADDSDRKRQNIWNLRLSGINLGWDRI